MFDTSTMTPPSTFHQVPTMHCYQPTMPLMGYKIPSEDNEEENNDDDNRHPLKHSPRQ